MKRMSKIKIKSRKAMKTIPATSSVRRREFMQQLFGGVGLAAAGFATASVHAAERQSNEPYSGSPPQGKPPQFKTKLRITRLETFLVKPRWLFLKIHTDA